ncbi:MAG TPA: hypothetical protein VK395_22350 [Gemmataceae bacterium]|nr:hypothetical protein [Gemmataceae bacterium]
MSLLAYLLIILPMDLPLPRQVHGELFAALVRTAQTLELAGEVESWRRDDYRAEVQWCRATYRELRDAPPLADAARLPPQTICEALARFAEAEARWLCERRQLQLHHAEHIAALLEQANAAARFWRLAATATDPSAWVRQRRVALAEMRQLLDHDRYYAEAWP